MSEVRGLFFEIENDHGIKVDVPAGFFSVPRGSWKIIPGSSKRGKGRWKTSKRGIRLFILDEKALKKI